MLNLGLEEAKKNLSSNWHYLVFGDLQYILRGAILLCNAKAAILPRNASAIALSY